MNKKTDVLIIGGGVIGLACAYYLNLSGRSVRIIEKDTVFSGASHGNCGLIFSSHLSPLCAPGLVFNEVSRVLRSDAPIYLSPKAGPQLLKWLPGFIQNGQLSQFVKTIGHREALLSASRHLYDNFFNDQAPDCDYQHLGVLMVFNNQESMETYVAGLWYRNQYKLHIQPLIGQELYQLEPALPDGLYGGWYYQNDSHLRPDRLGQTWKRQLEKAGVTIQDHCFVTGFDFSGSAIQRVVTTEGMFEADHFVLANGAWAPRFSKPLNTPIPIQPAKGYSVTYNGVTSPVTRPVYYHDKRVVLTPWDSGYRIGGILELSGWDHKINSRRIEDLRSDSRQLIEEPPEDILPEKWCGLRPLSIDDLPIISQSPKHNNLLFACGHGTTGFSMAPSTGKLITEIISNQPPHIDPMPYSIERF